jgi:hypothetical protein
MKILERMIVDIDKTRESVKDDFTQTMHDVVVQ